MAKILPFLKKIWWLITLGILLILIVVAVVVAVLIGSYYRDQADKKLVLLLDQYSQAQCDQVTQIGSELTGLIRFGLNSTQQKQLDSYVTECTAVNQARALAEKKDYAGASDAYTQYLADYPQSALIPAIVVEAQDSFLSNAEEKAKQSAYQDALTIYKDFLTGYPKSDQTKRAMTGYLDTYKNWVNALYDQKAYEQTLSTCKDWGRKDIPETGKFCDSMTPKILWNWGQQLEGQKKFDVALEKYQTLIADYPTSEYGSNTKLEIPKLYYNWGADLYAKNQKDEGVGKFLEALKLVVSSDPIYKDIWKNYPEAFIAYAKWLRGQGKLVYAVAILDTLRQAKLSEAITAAATTEFNVAVEALAGDTGKEGQSLLTQAYSDYCGKTPSILNFPALGFFTEKPGKAIFCMGGEGYYPANLKASSLGELRYYVKFSSQQLALGTCRYGPAGDYLLTRVQFSLVVNIYTVKDLKYYSGNKFYGSMPGGCPGIFRFYSKSAKLYGGDVDKRQVQDWLTMNVK